MKLSLILATLFMCQLTFAQSVREKRIKQEMLDRTNTLIEKVEGAREDLEKEDVVSACKKVKELFILYPEHLKSIGSHLDLDRNRTIRAKDQALNQLIYIHRQSLICDQGKDSEYVDPKKLRKELKEVENSLKDQRKTIKKSDTDNENKFEYYYEF
ncbi:MAG: hypothetical protein H0V66_03960 [Bdellovibrionales bacterium]|nr:hypothetical protein [Bdellovibrionales bacterium]